MAWVAIDTNIASDPSVHRIAAALRVRIPEAVGLLGLTFAGMTQHAPDGQLGRVPDTLLEEWARWHGKAGAFAAQFRAELTNSDGLVTAWEKHNGAHLRRLAAAKERSRLHRENKARERDAAAAAKSPHTDTHTSTHTDTQEIRGQYARTEQDRTGHTATAAASTAAAADDQRASMAYTVRCAVALNTAMQGNPNVAPTFREVPATSLAGQVEWESDGIDVELAAQVIAERGAEFRPSATRRQVHSLKYFDAAVRERWAALLEAKVTEPSQRPRGSRTATEAAWFKRQGYG